MMNSLAFHVERAKEWLAVSCTGDFSGFVMGKELGIDTPGQLDLVLADLRDLGLIEATGGKHGVFNLVRHDCPAIDWQTATVDWYPIWLPFDLHRMCGLRAKNVVVVAGETNAGKTLFALEIAYHNLRQNGGQHDKVFYFNSEMGPDELRARLTGIADANGAWRGLEPYERASEFHAVVRPDGLNIVDYMEVSDKFYLVADMIQKIHAKLNDGVCFILLQKAKGKDSGRGGDFTTEKARLALALSYAHGVNVAKITKCKNPRNGENPQGMELDYKIMRGTGTQELTPWRYVNEKERKTLLANYEQQQIGKKYADRWVDPETA